MTAPILAHLRGQNATLADTNAGRATSTSPRQSGRPDLRPARKMPLMRKYNVLSMDEGGDLRTSFHMAPADAFFEAAFSAFARGTALDTAQGPRAIEDLCPGDMIDTIEQGPQPVQWIGSMQIVPGAPISDPALARLTRIMAGSFGVHRPMTDVVAGPGARILQRPTHLRDLASAGPVFAPIRNAVDGMSVFEVTPPAPVTVYHLCLPQHATIKASGLEFESFHPGQGIERIMGQHMLTLFLSLFPHIDAPSDFGPLCRARMATDDPGATRSHVA